MNIKNYQFQIKKRQIHKITSLASNLMNLCCFYIIGIYAFFSGIWPF